MKIKTEQLKESTQEKNHPQTMVRHLTHPKIVVAIPCLNMAPYIADVVTKAKKYVDQVIVIDDGFQDDVAEIARQEGATSVKGQL